MRGSRTWQRQNRAANTSSPPTAPAPPAAPPASPAPPSTTVAGPSPSSSPSSSAPPTRRMTSTPSTCQRPTSPEADAPVLACERATSRRHSRRISLSSAVSVALGRRGGVVGGSGAVWWGRGSLAARRGRAFEFLVAYRGGCGCSWGVVDRAEAAEPSGWWVGPVGVAEGAGGGPRGAADDGRARGPRGARRARGGGGRPGGEPWRRGRSVAGVGEAAGAAGHAAGAGRGRAGGRWRR